ncbi:hypothetical protein R1sor_002317 [Riccia sorocarpa]|uniref:Uncharacterized protein n=1 Tax=Riccia sorocarpa TaxID=122646 RepID=A0ABD3H1V0_9MARC
MGSRTRQTRAVVSYRLDSSSDDSDDGDASFRLQRSRRNEPGRGNNSSGELEAGITKGRRSLALKKNRNQERGGAKDEDRAQRDHLDQDGLRQDDASVNLERSPDGNLLQGTAAATAFQRLVDAAVDAEGNEVTDEAIGDSKQMSAKGGETPEQPPEFENRNNPEDVELDVKPAMKSSPLNRSGREPAAKSANPRSKKPSKSHHVGSDEDGDWTDDDDFGEGNVSDSASDFSNENASDSDLDMGRPAKKRQTVKSTAAKKLRTSAAPRTSLTKGGRTKGGVADRKPSPASLQSTENTKTPAKSVGRPRKLISPCAKSVTSAVQGTGAVTTPSIPRLQPVKMRLKMASKEAASDGSPCGSAGRVPLHLIAENNLQHRRILGLSRRCRPPPLHPYLAGT